ncbi:RING finger protein B-like [Anabrus simplex]|uniref:RING finger protein B-like n=1 Tax=Anabrus simplex TaxID=316456 RepID=UPI0035A2FE80
MWSVVSPPPDGAAPSSRSKHSATLLGGHVYLLGGRNGNLPLKDLWRYSLAESRWDQLQPGGERPPCLQEHSAVAYRDCIYVFGGEVGFSAGTETPLWVYQVKNNLWRKVRAQKGVAVPRGRRGHTALVHRGAMLVYGGYQDLRGSSNELWAFHFDTESWHLLSSGSNSSGRSVSVDLPPARHKHSAILHDDAMWVYGGMTDLQERADFWRWDTVSKTWSSVKARPGPGALHSHAACKLPSSMLVFGGERDGHSTNELWRFHFGTESWERLTVPGVKPQPRAESVALAVSELLLVHHGTPTTPLSHSHSIRNHRPRGGGSVDRCSNPRHSSYHPQNNRVSPCERKYVFRPTSVNYVDGSGQNQESSRRCFISSQSGTSGNTNGSGQTNSGGNNMGFLREISKLSHINLSRLSHHKCSYSVLSSSSHDDSTESLLHQQTIVRENRCDTSEDKQGVPKTMVKSQSANILSRKQQEIIMPATSPVTPDPSSDCSSRQITLVSPASNNCKHSKNPSNEKCSSMTREPVSVPNFGALASSSIPSTALTPVEVTRLVYFDSEDELENNTALSPEEFSVHKDNAVQVQTLPSTNTRDFSFIHQQFQPSMHGSSGSKRSDSYNSHLMVAGDNMHIGNLSGSTIQNVNKTINIPKSASVRFRTGHVVTEFEETSDETVSTSDYASIETMNRISSASNYSMYNKISPTENNFPSCQQGEDYSSKFGRSTAKAKTPVRDGPFGFCNPNYLGPDIQTILASAGQRKSWHVLTPDGEGNRQQFQTYAKLLNSPPDSVLEDASGRSISRQFFQEESMELQSISQPTTPGVRIPPHFLELPTNDSPVIIPCHSPSPSTATPMGVEKRKKCRASSASRAESHIFGNCGYVQERCDLEEDLSCFSPEPPVPLYMFVLGGKEQGQVTVFKRPVSVWRLLLAPNIF